MNDEQLATMREAAKLASSMPEITTEIASMSQTTMTNAFTAIRNGALTPDAALSYWMELYGYHRLLKRFETKAALANQVTETRRN